MTDATRQMNLEADIDLRLMDVALEFCALDNPSLDVQLSYLRAAYGKGYCDALREYPPGKLCTDNGYRVPQRGE